MIKKFIYALISLIIIPLSGCNDDELDALKAEQEALSDRVLALESWQKHRLRILVFRNGGGCFGEPRRIPRHSVSIRIVYQKITQEGEMKYEK